MRIASCRLLGCLLAVSFGVEGAERKFTYSVRPGGGGPRTRYDVTGGGIAVDGLGQAHVLFQSSAVMKMNVAGNAALYTTYIPGAYEMGAIALDAQGNAYVTGLAWMRGGFKATTRLPGGEDGDLDGIFVVKLDAAGRTVYSLLLSTTPFRSSSGANLYTTEGGNAIAVDAEGNAYVGGVTMRGIATTPGAYQASRPEEGTCYTNGPGECTNGVVAKINAAGTGLVWGTYLGGSRLDGVKSLAVDKAGAVYVGGYTTSANFPVTAGALRTVFSSTADHPEPYRDGFLVKLSPDGRRLEYGTLVGGASPDEVRGVAVDGAGRAHLVGYTSSPEFPLKNEMQNEPFWSAGGPAPDPKAFLTIVDAAGRLEFSTFFGPWQGTEASTVMLGRDGSVYLGGSTESSDLPVVEAPQPSFRAGSCRLTSRLESPCLGGYFARIRPDLGRLVFSTFVGVYGPGNDRGWTEKGNQFDYVRGLALGPNGAVFATGYALGPFPAVGAFGTNTGATFVTRMESVGEVQANAIPPVFTRESVVMAPSGAPSVMRGSWVSIYGRNFLPRGGTVLAETLPLPTELAGVSVSFNGHAGRILSISSTSEWDQINVQVPWDIDGRSRAAVVVSREGVASYVTYVTNRFRLPEVFRMNGSEALVFRAADYSLVTQQRPAAGGEVLVLYATGLGPVSPAVADGAPSPLSPLSLPTIPDNVVTVNGRIVTPLFIGLAPGLIGIFQVNFILPADIPKGENEIGMRFGTPAKIWVQ
ncbi:MAG: SBBP repeat-containing protein [Bryobacterales bacterium]|nr:SBBP repeat-containing protein [Bryobacterales bacterium]